MTTILIVDDRPINREVLSVLLGDNGYDVLEAEHGFQALELIRLKNVDLIITDIAMPKMDGLTLVKELQADPIFKKIPIIFYSATYKAAEAYRLTNSSNVKYVLVKPCEPEIILGTIEGVLDPNSEFFNNKKFMIPENKITENSVEFSTTEKKEKKEKKEKLENINMRLTNLIEIGLDMSLENNVEKLIYILCKGGRQFLHACYGAALLKDPNSPNQYKHFIVDEENNMNFKLIEIQRLSESLKEIFLSEKNLCLHSPVIDMEKLGFNDIILPFSSLLTVPIKTTKGMYGKIYFINKRNRKVFSPGDQRFMMTLADKFAVNYENRILYLEIEQHVKQLEDVTERLHLTLEAAHVGTWIWSLQTSRVILDKYACLLLGLKQESYEGSFESFLDCLALEDKSAVNSKLIELSKNGRSDPIELRVMLPDKIVRHLILRGKVYYNEKKEPSHMLGVFCDITDHVQAEEKLRIYRQQMAEIVRSNSLGEVASSLAHEINQPLTAISAYINGCIKRLEHKKEVTPEIMKVLIETSSQADRAGKVIHRIKNFVRKGELFYDTIDINLMIEQAIQLIQQEPQSGAVEIIYLSKLNLLFVEIDKIQIQQVILNLLRNAMEAMKDANIPAPKITIGTQAKGKGRIIVSIIDNGPGFSEQTAAHLFELYYTTKSKGMGLGLAICRSIIEAHSGQLSAFALPQGGSCFQFDLPIKNRTKKQIAHTIGENLQSS